MLAVRRYLENFFESSAARNKQPKKNPKMEDQTQQIDFSIKMSSANVPFGS